MMKLSPVPRFPLLALTGVLAFVSSGVTLAADTPINPVPVLTATSLSIPASDPSFRFEGRFDFSAPAQPIIIWSGSRIRLDFSGDRLVLVLGPAVEQNFFNLTVDGAVEIVGLPAGPGFRYVWPHPLDAGRHRLELFKRSEAAKGHVTFCGVELASGAQVFAPAPPDYKMKMEFFGDSITAGACNEDGLVDQWDDFRTHNHALSYAALTSAAFHADHRAMAVSGMGIVMGYVDVQAGEIWNKIYPRPDSRVADLASWQPDVAFVNYGENDDSFSRNQHLSFPSGYTAGYVSLVKAIRAVYPSARIVLLRGGMYGGAQSPELRAAWEAAVKELEAGDAAISHYVFTHWSELHPRVSDDRALAAELTSWLKQQPFMTSLQ